MVSSIGRIDYAFVSSLPTIAERDFEQVRIDLEKVVARLKKNTSDAALRRQLLRQLRNLLREADLLIAAEGK